MASAWKDDMDVDSNYGTTEFWAGNRARSQLLAKFFPGNDAPNINIADMVEIAGDDRALFFGIGRDLTVITPTEYTSGYAVGKFRNTYATGGTPHHTKFVDADYFLMRSAEAYLIAAEAACTTTSPRPAWAASISTPCAAVHMLRRTIHIPLARFLMSVHASFTGKDSAALTSSVMDCTTHLIICGTGRVVPKTVLRSRLTAVSLLSPLRI